MEQQIEKLENILDQVGEMVGRGYLARLERCEPQKAGFAELNLDLKSCGQFYRLERLVLNKREIFLDNLTTVLNVAVAVNGSVVTLFHSDGQRNAFYMGVISKHFRSNGDKARRESIFQAVMGAARGNLPGSRFQQVESETISSLLDQVGNGAVCAVSGIPDLKTDAEHREYLQGLERLGDAMRGRQYAVLFIADPIAPEELFQVRQGYEELFTQLSAYASQQVSINRAENLSRSNTYTENFSESLSKSLSKSQSTTESRSRTTGTNSGYHLDLGLGVGIPGAPASIHGGGGIQRGRHEDHTAGTSESAGIQTALGTVTQKGTSTGRTDTVGSSSGVGIQFNWENRGIRGLLDRIQEHLKRLSLCESVGAVQAAAYVLAPDQNTAMTVAGNYSALLRGNRAGLENAYLNVWSRKDSVQDILKFLSHGMHPCFYMGGEQVGAERILATATTLLSSREAAQQLLFPQEPLDGIPVLTMAPFGRNPPEAEQNGLNLGELIYLGQSQNRQVSLNPDSLTSHVFITGSTGAGKSNAIYTLLDQLCLHGKRADKPTFLVVEPAKGEYKEVLGGYPGVRVYGTNPRKAPLLRLNPFSFPEDTHVLEHIDRLIEIFNACWPMYAAMPAVLKAAVEHAYKGCGWSMSSSQCAGMRRFPTFRDVMCALSDVVDSKGFSQDTQGDYKGALLTRLESLTNGINGQVLCAYDELEGEELFDQNVIVDLSRVGSSETKALLMGTLILKLQEHRMAQRATGTNRPNSGLLHITVLEEAHSLLRRTSTEQSQEDSNLQGKSVEMLTNAIAEMRTYGEGFIIADQSPGLLDMAVIRNTNTKLILRLPDEGDRILVGKAAGLNDDQIVELSRLDTGVAAVYQNHWLEPVLCKVSHFNRAEHFSYAPARFTPDPLTEMICQTLLQGIPDGAALEREGVDRIRTWIDHQQTGKGVKKLLYQALIERQQLSQKERDYALYCLAHGKHLIEEIRRFAVSADEFRTMADRQIMESLMVPEVVAREIRRVVLFYAADNVRNDIQQFHELQELGGVR